MYRLLIVPASLLLLLFSNCIPTDLHAAEAIKPKAASTNMAPPMHAVRKRIVTRLMIQLGYAEKTASKSVASNLTSRMMFMEKNQSSLVDRLTQLGLSKTYSAKLIRSELAAIKYAIAAITSDSDPEDKISTYDAVSDTVTMYLPGLEGEYDLEQLCPYAVEKPKCTARGEVPLDYIVTGSTGASWVFCCDVNRGVDYGFSIADEDYSDCISQINEAIQMAKNEKAEREGAGLDVGEQLKRLQELDQMLDDIADLIRADEEEEKKEDSENSDDENSGDDTTDDSTDDNSGDADGKSGDDNSGGNSGDQSQG